MLELARWEETNQVCLPTSLRLKWKSNTEWQTTVQEFDTRLAGNLMLEVAEPVEPAPSEQPEIDQKYRVRQECDIGGSCVKELCSQLPGLKLKVQEVTENDTPDSHFEIWAVSTDTAVDLRQRQHIELMSYQGLWVKPPKSAVLMSDPHCLTFNVKSDDPVILQIEEEGGAPKDARLNCSYFLWLVIKPLTGCRTHPYHNNCDWF